MSENKVENFLKKKNNNTGYSFGSLKALKRRNVFSLQRGDNLGVSGRRGEISKDLQLFTEDEQVVPKPTVIQEQEQEQILWESQVLRTLLS